MVSKLFRETESKLGPVPVDRTARLLFGSPFQLYRAYMLPTLAHAAVNNKLRRLSLMGVLGITAMAVGGDDDEAMDAMAGGPGREGMPLSDQAQRMIAEFMEPIDQGLRGIGDGMGFAVDHDGKARSQAGAWFKGLLNAAKKLPRRALQLEPFTFQTISSPGETRMSSGEDFDTLTDMALDVARGVRAGANGSMEDAARGLLSGIYGLVPNAMAGSALSAARVFRGQSGKPRGEVAVEELRGLMGQVFPVGSPMWTFSPTMMKGHEALNGRSFLDSIRGIERIVEDPGRRALGSFVFGELSLQELYRELYGTEGI